MIIGLRFQLLSSLYLSNVVISLLITECFPKSVLLTLTSKYLLNIYPIFTNYLLREIRCCASVQEGLTIDEIVKWFGCKSEYYISVWIYNHSILKLCFGVMQIFCASFAKKFACIFNFFLEISAKLSYIKVFPTRRAFIVSYMPIRFMLTLSILLL